MFPVIKGNRPSGVKYNLIKKISLNKAQVAIIKHHNMIFTFLFNKILILNKPRILKISKLK